MPDLSYDVVILGTGPAGLQAAIHAARRKVSVLVLGKETRSSIYHHHLENYCCVFDTTGEDIIRTGRQQAESFGAVLRDEDVLAIEPDGVRFKIALEGGDTVRAPAVIIATGTARKRLNVPGERELAGKGVSYCVECDCNFYKGQDVAVVGGGSAAASGAMVMLNYARTVHLVCDRLDVAAGLEAELRSSAVRILEPRKVKAIHFRSGDHANSPPPRPCHCGPGTRTIRRTSPLARSMMCRPPSGPATQKPSFLPSAETRGPVTFSWRFQSGLTLSDSTSSS